jgi:hypothetical protein
MFRAAAYRKRSGSAAADEVESPKPYIRARSCCCLCEGAAETILEAIFCGMRKPVGDDTTAGVPVICLHFRKFLGH